MIRLVPRSELNDEQNRVVRSTREQHRLVLGSPGSGKTIVLLHRAYYLMKEEEIKPERFRLLVFTSTLKKYMHAALRELELPSECAMTFDTWCREYYWTYIGRPVPKNNHEAIRRAVYANLLTASNRPLEFVMVDEGQDLNRRDFATLAAAARHVTVFMDPKSKIHVGNADEAGVAEALGLRPCRPNHSLLNAYRCSPYIVQTGAMFIQDKRGTQQFIKQNCFVEKGPRQKPLLYIARDTADEINRLKWVIEILIDRDRKESIGILFPSMKKILYYARKLQGAGLEVEAYSSIDENGENALPDIDFNTSLPKLMPYPKAKGLTFDTVLMPRLNRKFFETTDSDRLERWLFVGITRATRWIHMSTAEGGNALFLDLFRELEERGQVAIERSKEPQRVHAAAPVPRTAGQPQPTIQRGTASRAAKTATAAPGDTPGGEDDLSDMF